MPGSRELGAVVWSIGASRCAVLAKWFKSKGRLVHRHPQKGVPDFEKGGQRSTDLSCHRLVGKEENN